MPGSGPGALYCFIDWLLVLPEALEIEYHEDMKRYEEGKKMAYVTTAERIGMKKGFGQGLEQGILKERAESERKLREERAESERKLREEKREIARKLLQDGMVREKAKVITGLTDEEIEGV